MAQDEINEIVFKKFALSDESINQLIELSKLHGSMLKTLSNTLYPNGERDVISDLINEINTIKQTLSKSLTMLADGIGAQSNFDKVTIFLLQDYLTQMPKLLGVSQSDLRLRLEDATGLSKDEINHLFVVK